VLVFLVLAGNSFWCFVERYDLKKGPVENHSRPDDCTFFFSGRNLEAANIWREHYGRKKTYSRLAGYVFRRVAFVLVLVQIDLIHFEHTKCISSTNIKTNTYP
jgi:hypothetical protein